MGAQDLTAWLGLGIAAFVALIGLLNLLTARQQWRTANNRVVFDLFQKRYEVYQEFRDIVSRLTGSGKADSMMFVKAAEATERAQFLFRDDLVRYLRQFTDKVRDLESYCQEQAGLQGDDLKKNLDAQRQLKNALDEFRTQGPTLFGQYIRFDQKIC
jgi:hypothetical protein